MKGIRPAGKWLMAQRGEEWRNAMLLCEDEAKGKCCPFGPLTVLAAGACGEEPRDYPVWFKCQASDCMFWRWNVEQAMPRRIMHFYSQETKEPDRRPEDVPKGWAFRPCFYHATRKHPGKGQGEEA